MSLDISLIPQERIKDLVSTLDNIQSNINNIGTDLTNNLVHKTGNETITGTKTHNIDNCDIYKSTVMDITNNPSEAHTIGINYADKNGNVHGQSFLRTESNGNVIQSIACLNHSQTSWAQFSVGFDSSDNMLAYLNGNLVKGFVTETYSSGTDWYRVWSDGWIEQGGKFVITNASIGSGGYNTATLTFIKPFTKCITYNVQAKHDRFNAGFSTEVNGQALSQVEVYQVNDSTGSFVNPFVIWTACGY